MTILKKVIFEKLNFITTQCQTTRNLDILSYIDISVDFVIGRIGKRLKSESLFEQPFLITKNKRTTQKKTELNKYNKTSWVIKNKYKKPNNKHVKKSKIKDQEFCKVCFEEMIPIEGEYLDWVNCDSVKNGVI
eukprot:GAHX01008105.1.p2 GENE.GAHX01008105.1~~GAHX01008105.1.p2  ORF type:complete len:133 (+),score=17.39 GAHX01008105.1:404-802(+)